MATRPSRSPLAIQRRQGSGQSSTTEAELDPSPVSEDAGPRDDEVAFPFDRYRTAPLVALCDTLAVATLQVDSNRYGWSLVIDQTPRSDYYRAELRCGSTQAGVEFYYGKEVPPVGDFFKELAESWGGWEGERAWGSLDGEVELLASHDKLGTVTLAVRLRSDVYETTVREFLWTATALLFLDAGRLDPVARAAARLDT